MAGNTNSVTGYTEAFYNAYKLGYEAILQEKRFFWEGTMRMEALEGENKSYDFVSSIELDEKEERFGDIPIEDMTHNRRWISPRYFRKGIYVDSEDQIMLQSDPTSAYMQALMKGSIRTMSGHVHAPVLSQQGWKATRLLGTRGIVSDRARPATTGHRLSWPARYGEIYTLGYLLSTGHKILRFALTSTVSLDWM